MKCYGQIIYESGSYRVPGPDEFETWSSIKAAKQSLAMCWDDIDAEEGVSLLLWVGEPEGEAPCDMSTRYPDKVFWLTARGAVRESR